MAERRQSIRQKSFLRGCVHFNKRRGALDCLIRDYSEHGARIIFSESVSVPDLVELYIPQKEQTVRARVQWRCGDEIGLAFPDALRAADGSSDGELALRVAHLESEIAALKKLVKKLRAEIASGEDADAA
jgi:PilZ domain